MAPRPSLLEALRHEIDMANISRSKSRKLRTCAIYFLGAGVLFLLVFTALAAYFGPQRVVFTALGFINVLNRRVDFTDAVSLQYGDYPPTSSIVKRDRFLIVEDTGFQITAYGAPNTVFMFLIEIKNTGSDPLTVRIPAMTIEKTSDARRGDARLAGMTMDGYCYIDTRLFEVDSEHQEISAVFTNISPASSGDSNEKAKTNPLPKPVIVPPSQSLLIRSTIRDYAKFDLSIDIDIKRGQDECGYRLIGKAVENP